MNTTVVKIIAATITPLILSSCGGGGGGGGSSSGSNATNGIRVLHSAIDATPVTLTSSLNTSAALETVSYADQSFYVDYPQGSQTISVTLLGNDRRSLSTAVNYIGSGRKSVVLYEPLGDQDYAISVLDDAVPALDSAHAAIQVVHTIGKEGPLAVTVGGTSAGADIQIGAATSYQLAPAGAVSIVATRNGGKVYSGTFNLSGGSIYSLVLTGEQGYLIVGKLLAD